MRMMLILVAVCFLASCSFEPTLIYIVSDPTPPYLEVPAQVPDQTLDFQYSKAMKKDPCFVASQITGALSIEIDSLDRKMIEADYFANRFACMWEKQNFEEMYKMFTPKLQNERTLESFVNIMNHFKVKDRQPYAVRVEKIEFFEGASVAHVFFSTNYKVSTSDIEWAKEPRLVIYLGENGWKSGGLENVFFEACAVHSDCKVGKECAQKCGKRGLPAQARCVQVVNECSCYCYSDQTGEISFYDLAPR